MMFGNNSGSSGISASGGESEPGPSKGPALNYKYSSEVTIAIDSKYFEFLNDPRFVAGLLVLVGTMFGSCWSVDMEYLEDEGITWSQMFLMSQIEILIYASCVHSMILLYHYNKNDDYYIMNGKQSSSFVEYFQWIFPPMTKEYWPTWRVMIGRGIFLSIAFEFKIIALIYCNAGDVMVIRSVVTSFGMVVVSISYFNETLTRGIIFAFSLSLIGVVLIVQPSFLFTSSADEQISLIGLLFTVLAGCSRVCEKSFVKQSNTGGYKIHWMAIILVPYFITFLVSICVFVVVFVCYLSYFEGDLNEATNTIWYAWYDSGNGQNEIINFWIVVYGMFLICRSVCNTIGYQTGDMSRLGVIANSDVMFAYLVQAIALDVICDYLVYIGASIVVLGAIVLFYEQAKIKQAEKRNREENEDGLLPLDDEIMSLTGSSDGNVTNNHGSIVDMSSSEAGNSTHGGGDGGGGGSSNNSKDYNTFH